jgi:CrcB protein
MIKNLLLVGLGGGVGSIIRYLFYRGLASLPAFAWGTFAVNIIGCFLIGLFWGHFVKAGSDNWKLLLMTGFCGGFTTFSAFTLDGINLLREQKTGLFFLYTAGTVVMCLLATFVAIKISRG